MIMMFLITLLFTAAQAVYGGGIITIPLVHHNSVHSPFYKKSATINDRAQADLMSSLSRAAFYLGSQTDDTSSSWTTGSKLSDFGGGFHARIEVGSQNMVQRVVMDTGSGLLWINCQPSTEDNAMPPIFNPADSSSYGITDCITTDACEAPGNVDYTCKQRRKHDNQEICSYIVRYANGQLSEGTLSVENFRFQNNPRVLQNVVFGCSTRAKSPRFNGILGLARTSFSILRQKQYSKFAYCIGDLSDPSYPHNKLIIGDIANTSFPQQTPIVSERGNYHYYINLLAIYISGHRLEIDLRRDNYYGTGGTVIDSGSTYTFFPRAVYDKFEEVMIAAIDAESFNSLSRNYGISYRKETMLCYYGAYDTELSTFPTVTFVFQGGAAMRLFAKHLFQQYNEETFCLGVLSTQAVAIGGTITILGNLAQQFLYIGFDLDRDRVVFQQNVDCSSIGY